MITIELNDEQAKALRAVVACVGGDPEWSARKYIDDVIVLLEGKGYMYSEQLRTRGSVHFEC